MCVYTCVYVCLCVCVCVCTYAWSGWGLSAQATAVCPPLRKAQMWKSPEPTHYTSLSLCIQGKYNLNNIKHKYCQFSVLYQRVTAARAKAFVLMCIKVHQLMQYHAKANVGLSSICSAKFSLKCRTCGFRTEARARYYNCTSYW